MSLVWNSPRFPCIENSLRTCPALTSGSFEKNNLDWQFQQLSQHIGEWFEGLFGSRNPNAPDPQLPEIPDWLLKGLFWLILIGAIAWAIWQLYRLFRPYLAPYWHTQQADHAVIEPLSVKRTPPEWLQQAQAAHQQGDYRTACRFLYLASLQQLNDRGIILQDLSRTDGEYLSLMRTQDLAHPYQVIIHIHERICFDRVTASPEIYDRCWRAYQEIEQS